MPSGTKFKAKDAKYTFQQHMLEKKEANRWTFTWMAEQVSEKLGHNIPPSTIHRLLYPVPTVPAAEVQHAIADLIGMDRHDFVVSVAAAKEGLTESAATIKLINERLERMSVEEQRYYLSLMDGE